MRQQEPKLLLLLGTFLSNMERYLIWPLEAVDPSYLGGTKLIHSPRGEWQLSYWKRIHLRDVKLAHVVDQSQGWLTWQSGKGSALLEREVPHHIPDTKNPVSDELDKIWHETTGQGLTGEREDAWRTVFCNVPSVCQKAISGSVQYMYSTCIHRAKQTLVIICTM